MKIKLSKENADFLRSHSTAVETDSKTKFMYMPYWFKETDEGFEVLTFDRLPKELTDKIKEMQGADIKQPKP